MKNIKVVIVEEEEGLRGVLVRVLERLHFGATDFATADEAVKHILTERPHLVITDVDMPGQMNGIDLLKRIKADAPEIIVINMSGNPDNLAKAEANGSDGFLAKPFTVSDLEKMVEELGLS